jgi:hypothetical protein
LLIKSPIHTAERDVFNNISPLSPGGWEIREHSPNMIEWFEKYFRGSQPAGARVAVGVGQLAGLGIPARISLGMATR